MYLRVARVPGSVDTQMVAVPGRCQADLCQDPKKIQDPGSAGSKIWDPGESWIQQLMFCRGIQGILDSALQILRKILWILDPAFLIFSRDLVDFLLILQL